MHFLYLLPNMVDSLERRFYRRTNRVQVAPAKFVTYLIIPVFRRFLPGELQFLDCVA